MPGHESDYDESDKFYESNPLDIIDDLKTISSILKNCRSLRTILNLNNYIASDITVGSNFSTLFLNIDGNRSNFDAFAIDIHLELITNSQLLVLQ